MPFSVRKLLLAACLATGSLLSIPAPRAQEPLTAVQAIERAQERFEGEPIDVETDGARKHEPAGEVFDVKLLTEEGDVIEVRFSAADGRYLGAEGEDISRARKPYAPSAGARP